MNCLFRIIFSYLILIAPYACAMENSGNGLRNKWFGNTAMILARVKSLDAFEASHGLSIAHSVKTKTPLHHLISHQQIYSSCGFNSLANAYALERQCIEGLPITTEATRYYAECCFAIIMTQSASFKLLLNGEGILPAEPHELEIAEKDVRAKYNMPFHVIYLSEPELVSFQDVTSKQPLIELILQNHVVHFVINAGGHWVLASVVKSDDDYALYYLNSTNERLFQGSPAAQVIEYIDELVSLLR